MKKNGSRQGEAPSKEAPAQHCLWDSSPSQVVLFSWTGTHRPLARGRCRWSHLRVACDPSSPTVGHSERGSEPRKCRFESFIILEISSSGNSKFVCMHYLCPMFKCKPLTRHPTHSGRSPPLIVGCQLWIKGEEVPLSC